MKALTTILFLAITAIFGYACQQKTPPLTEKQKEEIIQSASATVQKVFDASNNFQFTKGLDYYADDPDAYYVSDGKIMSLIELRQSYEQIGPVVEELKNSIDSWNAKVLSPTSVAFTLPIHLKLKLAGIPEYNGQLVWSAVLQKRDQNWVIVQSHESWLNCAEVEAALTPAEP